MNRLRVISAALAATLLLGSCSSVVEVDEQPEIFPDYKGVTVPAGIAPMDFNLPADYERVRVEVVGSEGGSMTGGGRWARFGVRRWKALTEANKGGRLTFRVSGKKDGRWERFAAFDMEVSREPLDEFGITYRQIAPGYTTFSSIGIYQRDLHSFKEYPMLTSTLLPGQCMGCHTPNRTSPDCFMFHVRGAKGGTFIRREGKSEWVITKTDQTIGNIAYTNWHPSGNYYAGSIDLVRQCFWTANHRWIEVADLAADVVVVDERSRELLVSPELTSEDYLEMQPAFSADGTTIYFCRARARDVPREIDEVRYDLCSISFDPETGQVGDTVSVVIPAADNGFSVTWPRPSFDGRYLIYCKADAGCFPIEHKEADLWLMDLQTGENRVLDEVNSSYSESYHSWSSGSRWFLFSTRRFDGLYGQVYFSCIGDDGRCTKPFLLPQRNPRAFYHSIRYSFNVPDFTSGKVDLDLKGMHRSVFKGKRGRLTPVGAQMPSYAPDLVEDELSIN